MTSRHDSNDHVSLRHSSATHGGIGLAVDQVQLFSP